MKGSVIMPLPKENTHTIDDIYNLPEGTRAELIDGQIYMMAPPSTMHQRILRKLISKVDSYISAKHGECEVFPAPFAVALLGEDNEKNHVEPDISVICDPNKITAKGCNGAPDFIIEIVSPGNPEHDYITKLSLYKAAGVREYWIVDPRNSTITTYYFEGGIFAQHYTFTDTVKVNIYDDLMIDFSELGI